MALDPAYSEAIKGFEGYSPNAAWDYKQNSSGYGTKAQAGDETLAPDQLKAIHEQRFNDEIAKAAAHVDSVNPDLPAGARAALISLTYNAGPGWSQSGLGDLVRKGDLDGASARFLEYNKAGGEVNPALVARRAKEAAWFAPQQPTPQPAQATPPSPLMAAPQAPPIFPAAAQQPQPQQQAQAQPPMEFAQPPPMAPIFADEQRPIDISRLRAALQASGNRGLSIYRKS